MTIETGTRTRSAVITPVMKKKPWTWKLMIPYHQLRREVEEEVEEYSQEASPLTKKLEEVTETTQENYCVPDLERVSRHAERLQLPDK